MFTQTNRERQNKYSKFIYDLPFIMTFQQRCFLRDAFYPHNAEHEDPL